MPKNIPHGVNVIDNIREAFNMSPFDFYDAVKNGGKWDYKQSGKQYENFGNFNYGATGRAAGFPGWVLKRMAGWAQHHAGTTKEGWGDPLGDSPYGDDPKDQYWIDQGIDYFDILFN